MAVSKISNNVDFTISGEYRVRVPDKTLINKPLFPSKNALKITYGKVEIPNFPGVKPPDPLTRVRVQIRNVGQFMKEVLDSPLSA